MNLHRVESQLSSLERLVPHLTQHGCDISAQDAARALMRYFDDVRPAREIEDDLLKNENKALSSSTASGCSSMSSSSAAAIWPRSCSDFTSEGSVSTSERHSSPSSCPTEKPDSSGQVAKSSLTVASMVVMVANFPARYFFPISL